VSSTGFISLKLTDCYSNVPLQFIRNLRPVGTTPSPDLYVRADAVSLWDKSFSNLMPVLFAAECKLNGRYDPDKAHAQLATAFHGTLILLVLYYLDTRESFTMALPPWPFLYGIIYTQFSITIYAHHPSYDHQRRRWVNVSRLVSNDYEYAFDTGDPNTQLRLLAVLFKIRSHTLFVLEQLQKWDRAQTVLSVLLKDESRTEST